ncbi:MAG: M23 family metallopeptidase [Actinomyces sp.]|nr:MAG: M23 family metallopeptidase [Actinomyces sp.]
MTVGLGVLAPAAARGDDRIAELRAEREQAAEEAAAVAATLDELGAQDDELVAAIADLESFIQIQESKVAAAEADIAAAEAAAAAARAEVADLDARMDELREQAAERAVDAYVGADDDLVVLDETDLTASAVRRYLLRVTVGDEVDAVDALRAAQGRREAAEAEARRQAAEAEQRRADLADHLAELEASRAEADRLRAELQSRIEEWQRRAAELDAEDAAIEREIKQLEEEARRRAEEEARRKAEAARRAAEEARRAAQAAAGDDAGDTGPAAGTDPGAFVLAQWPLDGPVVSEFGMRVHPIFKTTRMHKGIDIDGDTGDPIEAASGGTVLWAGPRTGFGNTVIISHGGGFTTLYAHMSSIATTAGAEVSAGDVIGAVGQTGWATGPHLHFEVRVEGVAVDPRPFLP